MKKILLVLVGLYLNFNLFAQFSGGTGTAADPYRIATKTDLKTLSENSSYWAFGLVFIQTADIKFNSSDFQNGGDFYNGGQGFIPMGNGGTTPFRGQYYGQGFKIDSVYINRSAENYVGLFGRITSGTLSGINVTNCNITGGNYTGGIAGESIDTISNSSVSGKVVGLDYTGGFVGNLGRVVHECFSSAEVIGNADVGGFCGRCNANRVANCYAWGNVSGYGDVGGFVGAFYMGLVINSYSKGYVSGTLSSGGFVDLKDLPANTSNCFWDTQTSGQPTSGGGSGLNTLQMQTISNFTSANWDFVGETTNGTNDYWSMGLLNQDGAYPILNWQLQLCPSTSSSINVSTCGSYVSPSGNYTWTISGTYVDTIPNMAGCDSVITINLIAESIADQSLSALQTAFCDNGSTTINTVSSETGKNYVLRNNTNNSIVDGPKYGTGSTLSFNTGTINQTTTYNVYATSNSSALDFDGVDDELLVSGPVNLVNNSFTIETWAKRKSNGTYDYIASQGIPTNNQALHMGFRDNDVFTFAFWFDDVNTTATYTDTLWHHWACSFDALSREQRIYRDGALVANRTATGNYTGSGTFHIANTAFNSGNNFNGSIDEFRVWNTVRTQTEIQNKMNTCLMGTESGLLMYYRMDEANGTTVFDKTSNNNNALLNNMNPATDWVNGNVVCSTCNLEMSQHVTITISNSSTSTISAAECTSYVSPSGTYTWTTSGTYTDTIPNAAGCDSIITVNLSIINFQDIAPQASAAGVCSGGSATITIPTSQTSVNYYLRNNTNDVVVDGPVAGTGSALSFSTGNLTSPTTFNVYSELSPFVNNALDFDGVDDYLIVANENHFDFDTAVTIEAWIYPHTLGGTIGIVTKEYDGDTHPYQLRLNENELEFGIYSPSINYNSVITTGANIQVNTWTHVAATYDMQYMRLFINGQEVTNMYFTVPIPTNNAPLEIGRTSDGVLRYFDGVMDEVKVWGVSRTQAQIENNMTNCTFDNGLEGFYKFDQTNMGSVAGDFSENGNSAYLTNMDLTAVWVTGSPTQVCSWCNFEMTTTVTIDINNNTASSINVNACDSYLSPSGNFTWLYGGTYTDVIPNAAGCDSVITINLTINTADVSVTNNSPTLSANATAATYQWIDCDNSNQPIAGEINQSFTALTNGNYAVVVTQNSCSDTSACISVTNVGLKDNNSANSTITVYPNPSTGMFKVKGMTKGTHLEIYNSVGMLIKSINVAASETEIDLSAEANGMYILHTSDNHIMKLNKQF